MDLKRLFDLNLAVKACAQRTVNSASERKALRSLRLAQAEYERVILSQRLSESEKVR